MHSSRYDLGLLELQRFLIQPRPDERERVYRILNPDTQEQAGLAREELGTLARLLPQGARRLVGWSTRLDVVETEDESLVFTVRQVVGLWGQRFEIFDAEEHFMGSGAGRRSAGEGAFWLYDAAGLPFAEVSGAVPQGGFRLLGAARQELAVVTPQDGGALLVSLPTELAEQPLAKMLLLGAALGLGQELAMNGQ